tara:strand:+ start:317 stop:958 length:642 start_codon:yes stop_codon:yes gene_type:complete
MGFLDGSTITVDAILTGEGRKKLASGAGLGITKFSLSDDGVDYKLWNVNHASGSSYYGEAIDNLPNLEAITDGHVGMRYHLLTMDRDRVFLPNLSIEPEAGIILERQGQEGKRTISVNTLNFGGEAYTWKIFDSSAIVVNAATRNVGASTHQFNVKQEIPNPVVAGPSTQLEVMALPVTEETTTTIEIYGQSSGAVGYCKVTVKPNIRELPRS